MDPIAGGFLDLVKEADCAHSAHLPPYAAPLPLALTLFGASRGPSEPCLPSATAEHKPPAWEMVSTFGGSGLG